MSNRLIEDCISLENLEEEEYTRFISLDLGDIMAIVVDPYMINTNDLVRAKPGRVALVRARRPAWGIGDLHKYIYVIRR